jgi:Flp pilus assembly protein TadG
MTMPIFHFRSLLTRLVPGRVKRKGMLSDERGNVLILTAAMLIPLIALVGGAIDIGRYQMVKARLQSACDAGVLAGRRAMTAGTVDAFTPSVVSVAGSAQTVALSVATTLPTTLMRFFGYTNLGMSVTCNAKQDFVNTDVILVLDTTGSMSQTIPGDTDTKIVSLQKAVLAFYDQLKPIQDQLAAANLRLRFGIVPYSSAVNIGHLIQDADPSYMLSSKWTYQSRTAGPTTCYIFGIPYGCTGFSYGPKEVDISSYVAGNSVDVTPIIGNSDANGRYSSSKAANPTTWKGCIEERETTVMAANANAIPSGAYDLDIDRKPTNDATRWKPYWPELSYTADTPKGTTRACPNEAAQLKVWTRTDLDTYLKKLNADGFTYHDNGMMWGARLGSPDGIFANDNPATFNGLPVKRYIVFMTDGVFDTNYDTLYSAYGVEKFDKRVTPGGTDSNEADQQARHDNRFKLLCSRAKSMGYQLWVLVFDATLSSSLSNCASSASQASVSANSAALNAKFVEIGRNIGSLRLSQ